MRASKDIAKLSLAKSGTRHVKIEWGSGVEHAVEMSARDMRRQVFCNEHGAEQLGMTSRPTPFERLMMSIFFLVHHSRKSNEDLACPDDIADKGFEVKAALLCSVWRVLPPGCTSE